MPIPLASKLPRPVLRWLGAAAESLRGGVRGAKVLASLRACGLGHALLIKTYTTVPELAQLFVLAEGLGENARVIEVGSYLGASTCFLAAGCVRSGGRLWCIDTWRNEAMPEGLQDTFERFLANIAPVAAAITILRAASQDVSVSALPSPVDLALLDGDHSTDAVQRDFDLVRALVRPGGLVAFHDVVAFPGVSRCLGEALTSGQWTLAGFVNNLAWLRKSALGV